MNEAEQAARRQRFKLTKSEERVITALLCGLQNKEIAKACDMAEETAKAHIKLLMRKTGTTNRVALALHCIHLGYENGYAQRFKEPTNA